MTPPHEARNEVAYLERLEHFTRSGKRSLRPDQHDRIVLARPESRVPDHVQLDPGREGLVQPPIGELGAGSLAPPGIGEGGVALIGELHEVEELVRDGGREGAEAEILDLARQVEVDPASARLALAETTVVVRVSEIHEVDVERLRNRRIAEAEPPHRRTGLFKDGYRIPEGMRNTVLHRA